METSEAVLNNKKCRARSEPGIQKPISQVACCISDSNGSENLIQLMLSGPWIWGNCTSKIISMLILIFTSCLLEIQPQMDQIVSSLTNEIQRPAG